MEKDQALVSGEASESDVDEEVANIAQNMDVSFACVDFGKYMGRQLGQAFVARRPRGSFGPGPFLQEAILKRGRYDKGPF
jgi:methyl coenzyme M reductase beta subunit